MKNRGDMKKGASIIVLVLIIVGAILVFTVVATYLNNSANMLEDFENDFKSSLIAYQDELDLYIKIEKSHNDFKEKELNVYGDNLRNIIPYIKEEDMAKFGIKEGKIVYIGHDSSEIKWSNEILQSKE